MCGHGNAEHEPSWEKLCIIPENGDKGFFASRRQPLSAVPWCGRNTVSPEPKWCGWLSGGWQRNKVSWQLAYGGWGMGDILCYNMYCILSHPGSPIVDLPRRVTYRISPKAYFFLHKVNWLLLKTIVTNRGERSPNLEGRWRM